MTEGSISNLFCGFLASPRLSLASGMKEVLRKTSEEEPQGHKDKMSHITE